MAGQSSQLTLKEACMMQERIQHSGSHSKTHGGAKKAPKPMAKDSDHANAHNH